MSYLPKHLKLWTLPDSYFGAEWPDYYVFCGQHRGSDTLTRSNFISGLKAIGGENETVIVVRESHWAVGWVEWIAIHKDNAEALRKADEIGEKLKDYPVVDEDHFSQLEDEEAQDFWKRCFTDKERLAWMKEHASQFDFRDFADIRAQVRGEYFGGYASELVN